MAFIGVELNFDKDVLTPVSFSSASSELFAISSIQSTDVNLTEISGIIINWDSAGNVTENGKLGTLVFKVKDNASVENTEISILKTPEHTPLIRIWKMLCLIPYLPL